ncbi:isoprenylcysteine carboxyl methyltransferase family protein [Cytobacillus sp. IB215665]|uniref:isoprenylcysteine carboxyl methyltransferase family protein n=1 Tax=Cytobacillus sp. IB215665 TaxID=3097357 RepID=UPI002A0D3EA9|nr:isoprenylcysteine carboxylmethyltransferase family protein [Cytobacillus sp. IB215665]MDX8366392.1 isoprenylcysteine carboxylmethyltransferase family protein [Cytobacillus sp. IB215665]
MIFTIFLTVIIIQRLSEIAIAKFNEKWMIAQGGIVIQQDRYPLIVLLHSCFFISLVVEVIYFGKTLSIAWPLLLSLFFLTQVIRVWALHSLGKHWNTKIIILPNVEYVTKGPYKYVQHPNYAVVIIEFILIPIMFEAYLTALVFTVLNAVVLKHRIKLEESMLAKYMNSTELNNKPRFIPLLKN